MSIRPTPLEIWGGVECTINRVGEVYHDQFARSGHLSRVEDDLASFAALHLRTLRTALLWERFATEQNWHFADRCLSTMQELQMRPIVGLLHHGSGPPTSNLLDDAFPEKLASYALQVARRYPWVIDYTPVNEPQTTGRFACLYQHWYPHHASMRSYLRAVLHQIKAVVLSMRAVRTVQPAARLVHTEDGGLTFACPSLEPYRVAREQRQWLGLDLLCGRITPHHELHDFLLQHGATAREIAWFAENPCPPDVIGLNYYVTSDRYLDDRVELYAPFMRGGDTGSEPLVDIEAVRARQAGIAGVKAVLMRAWERYRLPLAITEAHLGCEPAEQIRWLAEVWRDAEAARAAGVDVRAVTVWGLLGLYDWCHLCTRDTGAYEPGVFDLSAGSRRATELAAVVRQLASGQALHHPALAGQGWWRQDARLSFPESYAETTDALQPA